MPEEAHARCFHAGLSLDRNLPSPNIQEASVTRGSQRLQVTFIQATQGSGRQNGRSDAGESNDIAKGGWMKFMLLVGYAVMAVSMTAAQTPATAPKPIEESHVIVNRSAPTATIVPLLIYKDVGKAIDWLGGAF
jgi:hypothetical protein